MQEYKDICQQVLDQGTWKTNRTGIKTLSVFNINYEIDLQEGFPLLTTKKINWKNIVMENLWFLSGERHIKFLKKHGANFWNPWADKDDYVPSPYGFYWRNFPGDAIDQVRWVLWELKRNPNSRRLVISAWDPANARKSALPPCHFAFVFNVQYRNEEPYLNLHLTQRSCDVPVGLPYNIAGYAFLLELFSRFSGIKAGTFAHSLVDAHIYENQIEGIKEQMNRQPRILPRLEIHESIQGLSDIDELIDLDLSTDEIMSYFEVHDYNPHPFIKFEVAV